MIHGGRRGFGLGCQFWFASIVAEIQGVGWSAGNVHPVVGWRFGTVHRYADGWLGWRRQCGDLWLESHHQSLWAVDW